MNHGGVVVGRRCARKWGATILIPSVDLCAAVQKRLRLDRGASSRNIVQGSRATHRHIIIIQGVADRLFHTLHINVGAQCIL